MQPRRPRIVIIGAGFGGLFCAKRLINAEADIILIDRQNHHLFQPLLYQVATGFLNGSDIAVPIRSLFANKGNVEIVMASVTGLDLSAKCVLTTDKTYPYDYLVLATGSQYHFFGHDEWAPYMLVLKTLQNSIDIRQNILTAFEQAEQTTDPNIRKAWLTFTIIGGGPTGVELAGAIADVVDRTLPYTFKHIRPQEIRIILLEMASRLLGAMPESLGNFAAEALKRKGITVHTGKKVQDVKEGLVLTDEGSISSHTILWAAGVHPVPISPWLGVTPDKRGGIPVNDDLSVGNMRDVFVIGDAATLHQDGKPLPALGAVASQQGEYLAYALQQRIAGKPYNTPFRYHDRGTMATIGRNAAVADFGTYTLKGRFAWFTWGIVHIYFLNGFRNRMFVFLSWCWSYLTYGMGARIIIQPDKHHPLTLDSSRSSTLVNSAPR